MNHYEKNIVEFLQSRHNFTKNDAIDSLERYYPVMQRLGWNSTAEEWAYNLNLIINEKKATPEEWNEFVDKYQKAVFAKPIDPKAIQEDDIEIHKRKFVSKLDNIPKELLDQFPALKNVVDKTKELAKTNLSTKEIEKIIMQSKQYQEIEKISDRISKVSEEYWFQQEIDLAKKRINELELLVQEKENEIINLKDTALIRGVLSDRAGMTFENLKLLESVVNKLKHNLPILVDNDQEWQREILESIDFQSKMIDLKKNEYMLYAGFPPGITHSGDETEALIECVVYQSYPELKEATNLKVMLIKVKNESGKWVVNSFSRS